MARWLFETIPRVTRFSPSPLERGPGGEARGATRICRRQIAALGGHFPHQPKEMRLSTEHKVREDVVEGLKKILPNRRSGAIIDIGAGPTGSDAFRAGVVLRGSGRRISGFKNLI